MPIELRDYQIQALESVESAKLRGVNKQLIVLPTGAGKTVVFASLLNRDDRRPALVLAHREELLVQARDKILWANPELRVEIEQGENYAHREDCDIVVASVPTLGRTGSRRIQEFSRGAFATIIVDEAHHSAASTYRNVLEYFDPDLLVGVTATPQRGDNVQLSDIFDEVVYYKTILELIDAGYLSPLHGYRINTNADITGVGTSAGDYVLSQLSEAIDTPERNSLIVKAYQEIVQGEKAVAFCCTVEHARNLRREFGKAGITAELVLGTTESDKRRAVLDSFRRGETQVIVNVGVLTEGFDEPDVRAILLARPTRSHLLYTQIVGRGTRLADGKTHCKILDFADVTRGKKPVGLPTVCGLPADFDLDGRDASEVVKEYEKLKSVSSSEASRVHSAKDIEIAFDRINLFRPPEPNEAVLELSQFIWIETAESDYHLRIGRGESLRIYRDALGSYRLVLTEQDSSTEFGSWGDLKNAFRVADSYVKQFRADQINLLRNDSFWRGEPPTEKQLKWLKKFGVPITGDLTKGGASMMLDRLFAENPKPQRSAKQQWAIKAKQAGKNF